MKSALATIEAAVAAIARGEMVVVVDSPARENEGDLVMAAEKVSPQAINFMATHGRGLICVALLKERLEQLRIGPMVLQNTDPKDTAFHVSVDHRTRATTGISASDRASTIAALVAPGSRPDDFTRPGHVFPLGYRDGGVLKRAGHTEASVDLARLAGLEPAGVLCEIASADGEMARLPGLLEFAREHGLLVVAISDLIAYRRRRERLVVRGSEARLPLDGAGFTAIAYDDLIAGEEHLALVLGDVGDGHDVLVRVHSECLTGDVFGSRYGTGMQILRDLGVSRMRLLTNNPAKRAGLEGYGLSVAERIPLVTSPTPENVRYLSAKQRRLGHLLDLDAAAGEE